MSSTQEQLFYKERDEFLKEDERIVVCLRDFAKMQGLLDNRKQMVEHVFKDKMTFSRVEFVKQTITARFFPDPVPKEYQDWLSALEQELQKYINGRKERLASELKQAVSKSEQDLKRLLDGRKEIEDKAKAMKDESGFFSSMLKVVRATFEVAGAQSLIGFETAAERSGYVRIHLKKAAHDIINEHSGASEDDKRQLNNVFDTIVDRVVMYYMDSAIGGTKYVHPDFIQDNEQTRKVTSELLKQKQLFKTYLPIAELLHTQNSLSEIARDKAVHAAAGKGVLGGATIYAGHSLLQRYMKHKKHQDKLKATQKKISHT